MRSFLSIVEARSCLRRKCEEGCCESLRDLISGHHGIYHLRGLRLIQVFALLPIRRIEKGQESLLRSCVSPCFLPNSLSLPDEWYQSVPYFPHVFIIAFQSSEKLFFLVSDP